MRAGVDAAVRPDLLQGLMTSPDIHLQKIGVIRNTALLVSIDPPKVREANFLDDRILTPNTPRQWVSLDAAIEQASAITDSVPLHFIFHSGHVGSTLVSRLLDEVNGVLTLREPYVLRQLAEAHEVVHLPESYVAPEVLDRYFDSLLKLWGRGFVNTTTVIVKAASSSARIAPLLLAKRPQARAIFLSADAETYITTFLSNPDSLIDLRVMAPERIRRLLSFGIASPKALHQMSHGELAAMAWLVESWTHQKAVASAPGQVMLIDFDELLNDPKKSLGAIWRHFGLRCDEAALSRIISSPVLSRYSKDPAHAFSTQTRAQILADSRNRHQEQIRRGLQWIKLLGSANAEAARVVHPNGQ